MCVCGECVCAHVRVQTQIPGAQQDQQAAGNQNMQVPWPASANHRPSKSAFTVPVRVRSSQARVRSRGAARFQANRLAFEGFALDCPAPHVTQDRVMSCNKA